MSSNSSLYSSNMLFLSSSLLISSKFFDDLPLIPGLSCALSGYKLAPSSSSLSSTSISSIKFCTSSTLYFRLLFFYSFKKSSSSLLIDCPLLELVLLDTILWLLTTLLFNCILIWLDYLRHSSKNVWIWNSKSKWVSTTDINVDLNISTLFLSSARSSIIIYYVSFEYFSLVSFILSNASLFFASISCICL